jgi:hypothetical protein
MTIQLGVKSNSWTVCLPQKMTVKTLEYWLVDQQSARTHQASTYQLHHLAVILWVIFSLGWSTSYYSIRKDEYGSSQKRPHKYKKALKYPQGVDLSITSIIRQKRCLQKYLDALGQIFSTRIVRYHHVPRETSTAKEIRNSVRSTSSFDVNKQVQLQAAK